MSGGAGLAGLAKASLMSSVVWQHLGKWKGRCEGGRQESGQGLSWPIPGRTASESNEMWGGLPDSRRSATCTVLLLLREPPSVLLQTSAPGRLLVAVAGVLRINGFILWPPAMASESGLSSRVGSLSRLPASNPVDMCCPALLHPPQEKPGVWPRGSQIHGWSQTPIHFSPSLAALAVPWAPGIRQAFETCLLIGQIIVPTLCSYHKNT